jgi:hypothetical protein
MGGAGVQQCEQPGPIDDHDNHYGAGGAWLDASQGMDGDRWLPLQGRKPLVIVVIHNFYYEQLLAMLPMTRCEELVRLEALPVLATLGDL